MYRRELAVPAPGRSLTTSDPAPTTPGRTTLVEQLARRGYAPGQATAMIDAATRAGGAPLAAPAKPGAATNTSMRVHSGPAAGALAQAVQQPVVVFDDDVVLDAAIDPRAPAALPQIHAAITATVRATIGAKDDPPLPDPGSADRSLALWPGGPVTKSKGMEAVALAEYLPLIRAFEKAYGTGAHTAERLRRLNYSAYSHISRDKTTGAPTSTIAPGSVGGKFDLLINTGLDELEYPATAPPLAVDVLDRLFAVGSVTMPTGEVVDLSHLYCQIDYDANGEGAAGTAISVASGAAIAGVLSWTGDLASWFLEWLDPNKLGGIGEGIGGGDGGGGDGKRGADWIHEPDRGHTGTLDERIRELNCFRTKKCAIDDLLGDMDAQVVAPKLAVSIQGGGSIADALEQYYATKRDTGANRRFHDFVMRAVPAIPFRVVNPGPQVEVALGPDARGAIYTSLYNAFQALAIHPQPWLSQLDVLRYVADQFADFLVIGLATGKATWPPTAGAK